MKIKLDMEKCIGCGSCETVCPEVFNMKDDMKAHIKKGKENKQADCLQESVDICPTQAIEIEK